MPRGISCTVLRLVTSRFAAREVRFLNLAENLIKNAQKLAEVRPKKVSKIYTTQFALCEVYER